MRKEKSIASNIALNWFGHGLNLVVMFFLTPYVVSTLGKVEYGIWSLLVLMTGYMGILDVGIRASTGRHITLYIGRNDSCAVDDTIRTSLGFFIALGGLVVTVGAIIGINFPIIFSDVPIEYHGVVRYLLPLLAFNVILTAISAIFSSVLASHDRFDLFQIVNVACLFGRTIGTIYVLSHGLRISGLAFVVVLMQLVVMFGNYWFAKKVYPNLKCLPLRLSRSRLRELLGYGVAAFISSISYKLINQTDLFVVGTLIGIEKVAIYSIGGMLILYFHGFLEQVGATIFQPIQRAAARSDMSEVKLLCFKQIRITLVFGLPIYIWFLFFGLPFLNLWMGPEYSDAAIVLSILSLSKIFNCFSVSVGPTLAAMGYVRFNTIMSLVEALLNIGLSVLFVLFYDLGLTGVAMGTLVSSVIVRSIFHPVYGLYRLGIKWKYYFLEVLIPSLIAIPSFVVLFMAVKTLNFKLTWFSFILESSSVLIFSTFVGIIIFFPRKVLPCLKKYFNKT